LFECTLLVITLVKDKGKSNSRIAVGFLALVTHTFMDLLH